MRRLVTFGGLALLDDADPGWMPAVQRRPLLLLAIVARAGAVGCTREKALALLWPERDEAAARHLLDQACYAVRRALGREVLPPGPTLRLDPTRLACDASAFDAALEAGALEKAVGLHRAPFLDGVHGPTGTSELERWIDGERRSLAVRARDAAIALARRAGPPGAPGTDADAAIRWWRAAATLDPLDATVAQGLVEALAGSGDVPGALRQAELHVRLLRATLDVDPPPPFAALVRRLRLGDVPGRPALAPAAGGALAGTPASGASLGAPAMGGPGTGVPATGATATAAPAVLAPPSGPSLLPPPARAGAARPDGSAVPTPTPRRLWGTAERIAWRASKVLAAPEPVESTGRTGPRRLWNTGERNAWRAGRGDAAGAAPRDAAGDAARAGRGDARPARVGRWPRWAVLSGAALALAVGAAVALPVLAARRAAHDEAARLLADAAAAYYAGDTPVARRLVAAALRADSLDAAAWLWQGRLAARAGDLAAAGTALGRAAARAEASGDERTRLHAVARLASDRNDPARLAHAAAWHARFPDDPEAALLHGEALLWDGRFVDALAALRAATTLDATRVDAGVVETPGATALSYLVTAHTLRGDAAAAERAARTWRARQPRSPHAARTLAFVLMGAGRDDAARALADEAATRGVADDASRPILTPATTAELYVGIGRFREADALLAPLVRVGTPESRRTALWFQVLSYRYQRRHADALAAVRRLRALDAAADPVHGRFVDANVEAQVRLEAGDPRAAAALFDSLAAAPLPAGLAPGLVARARAWPLALAAEALAEAGDTATLAARADSLAVLGPQSAYGRDRRLHEHVRGRLLAARGDHAGAVAAYQRALFGPCTFTRTNLALARSLAALGRPAEALEWLRHARRAGVEASALYLTHTDLHAAMAGLHARLGAADSAAHYRALVRRAVGSEGASRVRGGATLALAEPVG